MRACDVDPEEIAENVAGVGEVPRAILPDGPARDALVRLCELGGTRCYASGGPTFGTWCLWSEELADARWRMGRDGRVKIADWVREWPALLAEIAEYLVHTGQATLDDARDLEGGS